MPVELTPYTNRPSALESRVWTASHILPASPVFFPPVFFPRDQAQLRFCQLLQPYSFLKPAVRVRLPDEMT